MATTFFESTTEVDVATGSAFPDALGGGARAAVLDIPLLLTHPAALPAVVVTYLESHNAITDVVLYGGGAAISDNVLAQVRAAVS